MSGILSGKTALVTGASSGIGRSTAVALAEAGARVTLVARRAERLKDLAATIEAAGGQALVHAADVTKEDEAAGAVEDSVGQFGGLDILVNAAGMTQTGKVENGILDDWRYVFELNFWASMYTSRAAIPALKEGGGDIVNISSTAGRHTVGASFGPYASSKHALTAFNESLRAEVTLAGIRVSIIEPGATSTEIHEHIKDDRVRESTRAHIEKDGAMRPEDVARAIVFVVSLPPRVNISQMVIRPSVDTR
ncbi:MAG TPA: SDR family NAD(P)-dependent oxidoreductase, partial [Trebonia sp.]|nr:SDR family NAD(P)-dependent oxidoreductase [Trebonia sp.]